MATKDDMGRHGSLAIRWLTLQIASSLLIFLVISIMQYRTIREEFYGEIEATGRLAGQIFREVLAEQVDLISPEKLSPLLFRLTAKLGNIHDIEVVDASGRIVVDSDADEVGDVVDDREITRLLGEYGESFRHVEEKGRRYLRVAMSLEGEYDGARRSNITGVIFFDLELERAEARIRAAFIRAMLGTLLLLAVLWGAGHFLVTRLFIRRMGNVMAAARRLGEGDYAARTDERGSDELAFLATTFNEMAEGLQKSNARLESANNELQNFACVVSHDLKAPLRAISSLSGWLAEDYGDKLDDRGHESLNLLIQRAKRMNSLIDGILNYSRIGRVNEEMTLVDLERVVNDAIELVAPPEHVSVTIETKLPAIVCEETRIYELFQNLISNAVKHLDKPKGEIRVGCVDDGQFYTFYVADNGPGIEEQYFDRIFQMFQTLKPRDEMENTGVGLTIAKKIVEMYGGRIWVESRVGEGATFRFTLPKGEQRGGHGQG